MRKRIIMTVIGAVLLAAAAAAPALAADAVPYGWVLQLRSAKHNTDLTYKAFRHYRLTMNRQVVWTDSTDPANPLTYKGVSLRRLVGIVDDNDPATFNVAKAAAGYNVVVTGLDGFAATYTSAEVATMGKALIVADRVNDAPFDLGTASIKDPMTVDEVAVWKPAFPLKLVSSDPTITGKRKPAGVARIAIEPATPPAASGAAPF
jgi:hypothetical protein